MLSLVISALLFSFSSAETHTVKVGNDGLNIDPDTIHAAVGDVINFEFYPNNHSIAQSSYDKPCEPLSGGVNSTPIFSGFFPVDTKAGDKESKKMFSMTLNSTDPIWLYCSQGSHCQDGQVMVINVKDDSDQTLDKYKDAAKKSDKTTSPAEVFGGVVMDREEEGSKTTKGNPGTPATATMSTSTSTSATSTTSSSTSATPTSAAGKISANAAPILFPALLGITFSGICGVLA